MNVNESEAMRRLPRTCRAADWVLWFDEVDSTNTVARRLLSEAWQPVDAAGPDVAGTATVTACAGAAGVFGDGIADAVAEPPIAVIVADSQTAGHGRLGRQWVSRPGESSMVSFATVLPQSLGIDSRVNGWLQMIAGLVTLDALNGMIEEYGAAPNQPDCSLELKWPNDVFCHGLKLGGLLSELVIPPSSGTGTDADVDDDVVIVFGVGLNLALGACRLPTPQSTSLQLHVSGLPSFGEMRDAVAERQVEGFRERLVKFIADPKGQAESLREEVKAVCWARGRQVEAHFTDGTTLTGEAIGLNEDASLILRTQDGTDHTVRTADVGVL